MQERVLKLVVCDLRERKRYSAFTEVPEWRCCYVAGKPTCARRGLLCAVRPETVQEYRRAARWLSTSLLPRKLDERPELWLAEADGVTRADAIARGWQDCELGNFWDALEANPAVLMAPDVDRVTWLRQLERQYGVELSLTGDMGWVLCRSITLKRLVRWGPGKVVTAETIRKWLGGGKKDEMKAGTSATMGAESGAPREGRTVGRR